MALSHNPWRRKDPGVIRGDYAHLNLFTEGDGMRHVVRWMWVGMVVATWWGLTGCGVPVNPPVVAELA